MLPLPSLFQFAMGRIAPKNLAFQEIFAAGKTEFAHSIHQPRTICNQNLVDVTWWFSGAFPALSTCPNLQLHLPSSSEYKQLCHWLSQQAIWRGWSCTATSDGKCCAYITSLEDSWDLQLVTCGWWSHRWSHNPIIPWWGYWKIGQTLICIKS